MMKRVSGNQFMHPRHWFSWLLLGSAWAAVQLPWRAQMWLGKQLGLLVHRLGKKRRRVCAINLALAFPKLDDAQRKMLCREHFISLGRGLLEAALSWWGDDAILAERTEVKGIEHLYQAMDKGGVVLLSAHFTSLELGGRILAQYVPLHVVYRPHQDVVIEWRVSRLRAKRYGKAISRDDIRTMLRSLQQGHVVWYAQDQNYGHKNSVFAPFFDIEASTNTATSRIAKIGDAQVVPFFTVRTEQGYLLEFLPPLDDFPGESVLEDTTRINHIIEEQVRQYPAQYLWTHRRYKDAPDGVNRYKSI